MQNEMPIEIYVYDYEDGKGLSAKQCRRVGDTIYHHDRIVQAKDAEIAKLKQERDLLAKALVSAWGSMRWLNDEIGLARRIVRAE